MLVEQLQYNILFRCFVGLSMDDEVWHATTFTKNRQRLIDGDIAQRFFERVTEFAREKNLLSDEHFTVDGTVIEAGPGKKVFAQKTRLRPVAAAVIPMLIFPGLPDVMILINPRPIPTHGCIVRALTQRQNKRTSATS